MTELLKEVDKTTVPDSGAKTALQDEALTDLGSNRRVVGERVELLDSEVPQPKGKRLGETDPNKEMTTTIMVKSKASDKEMDETIAKIARHEMKPLSDAEFKAKFGADETALAHVMKFAADYGLTASEVDEGSGRILLKGKVKNLDEAFKVKIEDFKTTDGVNRERNGIISVPMEIANDVRGVFGLDTGTQAHSQAKRLDEGFGFFHPRVASSPNMPDAIAKAYDFPTESSGAGQSVAIIQLGGGLNLEDNAAYYKQHGLKLPDINIISVDGGQNKMGVQTADDEVALDSQIIGVVAPDAKQNILFAPNSDQGFLDAITRATFNKEGESSNSAISISWGAPESFWSQQARDNMTLAFKKAALKGITVFVATGDKGAKNGTSSYTADYPAADMYVTATGGTVLKLKADGSIDSEVAWKDGGGGLSRQIPVPDFQNDLSTMPPSANHDGLVGRGVPDVAGDASPSTGYKIRVRGQEVTMGGTSAVSPLYAALILRINSATGERAGFINPFL
ncbi:MAG: S53 family peptidase, partial [Candidatus Obscuribacterales bacterium]|nr:S53 family peptidase [Candidatus Obscuribacterales bacterium]